MTIRIVVSRHSAFYSPLISSIAAGFLEQEGIAASYGVLEPGQRSNTLIREGRVEIMQSAVSSNWPPMEAGETRLPVHFAQINRRDGFWLVGREDGFGWTQLENRELLADHGLQPLTMLKYAVRHNATHWDGIRVIDAGTPEAMEARFRSGVGDYVHLQAPAAQRLEDDGIGQIVASVGASMPPVAFSSLCCSREFMESEAFQPFLRAFSKAKEWVQNSPPGEVADREASLFPGVDLQSLSASIARYQKLGCWLGGIDIPKDLYEQALNVFEETGVISKRHPYDSVCV